MQKFKTYFEQVPVEVVSKIVDEQSEQEESAEQPLMQKRETRVVVKPKDNAA